METNNNMKDFNIEEVLRYAPKGLKLYSPLFGEVKFDGIEYGMIKITDENVSECFYEDGRYYDNYPESECLLFPSINHRCWNNWQNTLFLESIGSVCVDTITGNKFILEKMGTTFTDNTGSLYASLMDGDDTGNYLLNSRYASPEEAKEFFEELNKNGYKWDGEKVVKKGNIKPKFKVGDVIRHKDTGIFFAIAEVKDDCYYSKGKTCLLFKYQDMWELIASKVKPTLEDKVNILADEIIALKERVKALEIQVIKQCSDKNRLDSLESKMIILDSYNINNRLDALESRIFPIPEICKCPDKAGDNVTLEEMKS